MALTSLQYRILELSYRHKLSHIGSSLGAAQILDEIYAQQSDEEPVILSAGHGGLGLYAVLEKRRGKNAEDLLLRHGVHPNRNLDDGIDCSTGSLGMGICVAVGRALANRDRNVWCVITDGELAEGAVYESLSLAARENLENLHVFLNANGWSACRAVPFNESADIAIDLFPRVRVRYTVPELFGIPFLHSLSAHYYTMIAADWEWVKSQEIVN